MATFECTSRDRQGQTVEKTLDAPTRRDAIASLEAAGLFPVEIKEILTGAGFPDPADGGGAAKASDGGLIAPFGKKSAGDQRVDGRLKGKALLNFTIQLNSMISAGVPILGALTSMAGFAENDRLRAILHQMSADLRSGDPLSVSMQRHPKAFSNEYSSSVAAGEHSGSLEDVLDNLADYVEADMELRSDVRSAILYPIIVLATLSLAIGVLILFVVPRFAKFYEGFDTELPLPTRILIGVSNGMTGYLPIVLLGLVGAFFGVRHLLRTPKGREFREAFWSKVPVFGHLIETANTLRVTQMLGLFTNAGVPILQGLTTIAATTSSQKMRRRIMDVSSFVASGRTLADSLEAANCLPPTARHMLASGESTGNLARACSAVSAQYKKELSYVTKNLSTLVEPMLTLLLAGVVLFVALAVFLPMWDMVKVIK